MVWFASHNSKFSIPLLFLTIIHHFLLTHSTILRQTLPPPSQFHCYHTSFHLFPYPPNPPQPPTATSPLPSSATSVRSRRNTTAHSSPPLLNLISSSPPHHDFISFPHLDPRRQQVVRTHHIVNWRRRMFTAGTTSGQCVGWSRSPCSCCRILRELRAGCTFSTRLCLCTEEMKLISLPLESILVQISYGGLLHLVETVASQPR